MARSPKGFNEEAGDTFAVRPAQLDLRLRHTARMTTAYPERCGLEAALNQWRPGGARMGRGSAPAPR
jgi:hypothetical protein